MEDKKKLQCPICNNEAEHYTSLKEVVLFYCKFCKHRFTDFNSIKKKETYSVNYFSDKHSNWFNNPNTKLFDYIYKFIDSHFSNNASILDVGCGTGGFLKYISNKSKKFNLTGIDYYKNEKYQNIEFLYGDILKEKLNKKYDVVISIMVIEHVLNVQEFIKRQTELCKDNGFIINVTINEAAFLYKTSRIVNYFNFSTPINMLYDKHHLNHFSRNSLEFLHKKNKLKIIENNLSQFNVESLTLPKANIILKKFYKIVLLTIFLIVKLILKKNQQTLICQKI